MQKLAVSAAVASSRHAAPPRFPAGSLLARLPSRLTDLPLDLRASLGRALDQGLIRLALDEVTGAAVVTRAGGR